MDDLNADDGVKKLILPFDKWYKQDDISAQYNTWRKVITYERKQVFQWKVIFPSLRGDILH